MMRNSHRKRITRTLLMNGAWGPRSYVVSRLLLLLLLLLLLILLLLAGFPRERDARGSLILIEYGRPLFIWLSRDWSSVSVYRLYGWGRGDYEKEGRGIRRILANPNLLYWTFTIWSIDSCQNRIATDQYHMTIFRAHVSTHRGDMIYLFGSCLLNSELFY